MKVSYKNNLFIKTLLLGIALLLIGCNGYGIKNHHPEGKGVTIHGGKEVLVASDIASFRPFWCGTSGRLIYVKKDYEIYSYDVKTGKSQNIAGVWSAPVGCTHDGKWLVYEDTDSVRYDKENIEETASDFWRYEFKTGRRQKFVIAGNSAGHLSPTGLRLYLGRRPAERIPLPEPHWDILWSGGRGVGDVWLSDGSAIIGMYYDFVRRRYVLEVEVFTPPKKVFSIIPPFQSFYPLMVDKQNRVYIRVDNQSGVYIRGEGKDKRLLRCGVDLKRENISCETIFKPWNSYMNLDVFSDGETIVFSKEQDDNCVRIQKVGEKEALCLTTAGLPMSSYLVISPDEKWLAFERNHYKKFKYTNDDLYIVELKSE